MLRGRVPRGGAGALNLIALRPATDHGRLRTLTLTNLGFTGLLLAVTVAYQFPPPMVLAAAAFLLFGTSAALQARG